MKEEELYCFIVSTSQGENYCHSCLATGTNAKPLLRCVACKKLNYCGPECQKKDWKSHKLECSILQDNVKASQFTDEHRFVLRLSQKWSAGDFTNLVKSEESTSIVNMDYRNEDPVLEFEAMSFLLGFNGLVVKRIVGDDVIKRLYKLTIINSVGLTNEFGQTYGLALSLNITSANHSCVPQTRVVFSKDKLRLIPTKASTGSASTLTYSFIDDLKCISERKSLLKKLYKLDCNCDGCLDEERNNLMEAWECQNCPNGWLPATEETFCQICHAMPDKDHVETCLMAVQAVKAGNESLKRTDLPQDSRTAIAEKLLELMEGAFHKFNVLRLPSLYQMYRCSLQNSERYSIAADYGKQLIAIHEQYKGPMDITLAYLKYGVAQVFKKLNKNEEVDALLNDDLLAIFAMSFGNTSQIYINCQLIKK